MKTTHPMLMLIIVILSLNVSAQTSVKDKMKTLEENITNSKANKEDYLKNLKIIEENIVEVSKAKATLLNNKKEIDKSKAEVKSALVQVQKSENELKKINETEKNLLVTEQAKIKQLEDLLLKLKSNTSQREAKLIELKSKSDALTVEKTEWLNKEKEVRDLENTNSAQIKAINATESQVLGKKKGYEAEINRWNKETEKHEKTLSTFQQLAN